MRKFIGLFGGALVEEFIEGREFTVLVAEGLPPSPSPAAAAGTSGHADGASTNGSAGAAAAAGGDDGPEATAFLPVECRFEPGESFKHFDLKWKDYESMT